MYSRKKSSNSDVKIAYKSKYFIWFLIDPVQSYLSGQKFYVGWSLLELLGPSATTTEFYRLSGQQQLAKRDFWVRACAASARAQPIQLLSCPTAQLASRLGQQRAGWPLHCCCSSSKVWGSAHLVVCVTPCVFT